MKTLKFDDKLVELILRGEKTNTWRLFDDKDLTVGDQLILINKQTKEEFAKAKIVFVVEKKIKDLNDDDWQGHERFASDEIMYKTYSEYYKREITGEDLVKIIIFELIP
ncbi:MAG: ASCH domain-containing protein [Patescibacteria group bacterium]|nr:ASCH domain-containing protein [Patescibacteria group bacterium]MDD4610820.1 ASCH domain-containing protein [Patescibacteria group bacterium]